MHDAAVRAALGISQQRIAELAGVGRDSVRLYEANPSALGERTRSACAHVYRVLRSALERLRPKGR
jgi:transcriptional regulator with XRE-family HTH domain